MRNRLKLQRISQKIIHPASAHFSERKTEAPPDRSGVYKSSRARYTDFDSK